MLASDSRYDELGTQRKIEGPDKIVELFKGWKTAFPDAAGTVTSAFASGSKAALEVTWKGTHTGPLETPEGTIPASGKRQETSAAVFLTFEGDKIKESRHYFDSMTLLEQIGAAASAGRQNQAVQRGRPPDGRPLHHGRAPRLSRKHGGVSKGVGWWYWPCVPALRLRPK